MAMKGKSAAPQCRKCGGLLDWRKSDWDCCKQSLEPVRLQAGARASEGTDLALLHLSSTMTNFDCENTGRLLACAPPPIICPQPIASDVLRTRGTT